MSLYCASNLNTQNELLLKSLMDFYKNRENLNNMMNIINGESKISLRIVDWFVTNYAKKNYTVYEIPGKRPLEMQRFKVYNDYKLKLKAYSKKNFDPFCRWERITIPYDEDKFMETTIGQLNFFKWAIENRIVTFIEANYADIENDMNSRNSTSKRRTPPTDEESDTSSNSSSVPSSNPSSNNSTPSSFEDIDVANSANKTRKKREELSVSACKCIKKENVKIVVRF